VLNLTFVKHTCKNEFSLPGSDYNFPLNKPTVCPICNFSEDGTIVSRATFGDLNFVFYGVVCYRCTHCFKTYIVVYSIDTANKKADFVDFFPRNNQEYSNELLQPISPRFISAYNQALRAEERQDIELAAIGYRHALECLIKDFAIKELNLNYDEVVKKSLCDAIKLYLEEKDLVSTADVIRILGNDYTHYERKYPEFDFALLKQYMEIFIKLVETRVLIMHPPVSR
jgi:hypothetical protein